MSMYTLANNFKIIKECFKLKNICKTNKAKIKNFKKRKNSLINK